MRFTVRRAVVTGGMSGITGPNVPVTEFPIEGWVQTIAINLNVTVNTVTPVGVRTPTFEQMPQSHLDFMLSKIPKRRFGTMDEVASLVCWLASEECSFSTGAVFDISGGRATY